MVSFNTAFKHRENTATAGEAALQLSDLRAGARAQVVSLTEDCQGFARRRLLDLGLSPGALVERGYGAPLGGPTAYRLRGITLALHPSQARLVAVREVA